MAVRLTFLFNVKNTTSSANRAICAYGVVEMSIMYAK